MLIAETITHYLMKQLEAKYASVKLLNSDASSQVTQKFYGLALFIEFYLDSRPTGLLQQLADTVGVDRNQIEQDIVGIIRKTILERSRHVEEKSIEYA